MVILTSLAEIQSFNPCRSGWIAILRGQNAHEANDKLFDVRDALRSNSVSDVCWLLGKKKEKAILTAFAKRCADSVQHFRNSFAAYAADAAAHAHADADAADAAAVHADVAAADVAAATVAAYVADAAAYAVAADADADADAAAADARKAQNIKNIQFLIQCITEAPER